MTTTETKAPVAKKTQTRSTARKTTARKAPAAKAAAKPAPKATAKPVVESAPQATPAQAKEPVKPVTRKAPAAKAQPAQQAAVEEDKTVQAEAKPVAKPVAPKTQKPAVTQPLEAQYEIFSSQLQEGYNEMFEFGKEQMEKFFKVDGVSTFKVVEDAMAFSKENVDAFVKSTSIAAKGAQDVASLIAELTKSSFEENVAAVKKMFECKSPQEAAELQAELVKSGYDKLVANATRISETSSKIAEEAAKPLQARVEAGVEKFNEKTAEQAA